MSGPQMLAAYREWRDSADASTRSRPLLIVGMSANSTHADQDEAFKHGMHVFATKPVESLYLKIFVDAVKGMIAPAIKLTSEGRSSTPVHGKSHRSKPVAKCIADIKLKLKKEGLDAVSVNGKHYIRITSYPLRC